MSTINIPRAVANIRSATTVYTPIVETVVNAIDAIEEAQEPDGTVHLYVRRSSQAEMRPDEDDSKILDVVVSDNGIGFTQANRDSFDTLYSEHKAERGAKGFGRLTCLRYFDDVRIDSIFRSDQMMRRQFQMGREKELIIREEVAECESTVTCTTVTLAGERTGKFPRKLSTIARGLVELLLPYFVTTDYSCPIVTLSEEDGSGKIILNEYVNSRGAIILEVDLEENKFTLNSTAGPQEFLVRVFKFLSPQKKVSKVSLVADKREVSETSLASYVPEFADEFIEDTTDLESRPKNYILKTYVFGSYLDDNVVPERCAFQFQKDNDLILGISQTQIEKAATELTKAAVLQHVTSRQMRKLERLQSYVVEQAPWYKPILESLDISQLPLSASETEMDGLLHLEQYKQEKRATQELAALLASNDQAELVARVRDIAGRVSESSKNELVHYVALRKQVLELFRRSMELDAEGAYPSEETIHNVIFPTKKDDREIKYDSHNLWILDERLTFTSYLASDVALNGGNTQRPDILAFNQPVAFRCENEASNPVTIFEFKKAGRDDFANPSSREDPIEQIVRYVNALRAGEYTTPKGREIHISNTTPFYGYVVCDLTPKVKAWLFDNKNFKPMPDGLGYFDWRGNINLYIEVLSWSKVLKDADMRNRAFFYKLGIHHPTG